MWGLIVVFIFVIRYKGETSILCDYNSIVVWRNEHSVWTFLCQCVVRNLMENLFIPMSQPFVGTSKQTRNFPKRSKTSGLFIFHIFKYFVDCDCVCYCFNQMLPLTNDCRRIDWSFAFTCYANTDHTAASVDTHRIHNLLIISHIELDDGNK